ncbi:matrixin family metalloprotease [Candidatus Woesearchaeota archaeon]|nr:matrixin family metalloprotease [Candidatus Woesearchaeota archaeon]
MKKTFIGLIVFLMVLGMVFAGKPDFAEKANPSGKTVSMPKNAVKVSDNVFYLGKALDNGKVVEGYAIMKYKKGYGIKCDYDGICESGEHPVKCPDCSGGDDPEEPDASSCYVFLSKGAKWKTIEPYIVDTTNTRELDDEFIRTNLAADIVKWEDAAGTQILGGEISGTVDGADTESTDGKNEVYFDNIEEPGAIGVTIIWGIFGGPPPFRQLVEWDQVYDDVDFDWGNCLEVNCTPVDCIQYPDQCKMDFENIATHELGHSVGMGDLYTSECSEQTMYGYAGYGETKKRTLEAGDKTGIKSLYG